MRFIHLLDSMSHSGSKHFYYVVQTNISASTFTLTFNLCLYFKNRVLDMNNNFIKTNLLLKEIIV